MLRLDYYLDDPYQHATHQPPLSLHEVDVTNFVDVAEERVRGHFKDTNLKRIRAAYGCTQAEHARRSGVLLRSIQMYEQRNKDINRAGAGRPTSSQGS